MVPSIQVDNPPAVTKQYPPAHFPAELKSTVPVGEREVKNIAIKWLADLNALMTSHDYEHVNNLFHTESWWRDLLSMKMDHTLLHTSSEIAAALKQYGNKVQFQKFTMSPDHEPVLQAPLEGVSWIQGVFDYETKIARGRGLFRLLPNTAGAQTQWKCFTFFTSIEELIGYEEKFGQTRPAGVAHGENVGRESWADRRHRERNFIGSEPAVVIVGAGQAGLNLAAHLSQLEIPTLIIDKNDRIGDNWRKRYRFLVLHDPIWYDHMSYIPFPKHWPVFTPKDKLADWFESYAASMELNVWMKTELKGATFDEQTATWTVPVKQEDGTMRDLHPKHLVLATGHSGEPNIPVFPGQEDFAGKIVHSSQHTTGGDFKGKKAIVVGCCNSGHDIAHDFYEQGAETTIVQRSSTYIMSSENGLRILFEGLYEEGGPSVEDADLIFHSIPNPLHVILQKATTAKIKEADQPLLDKLQKVGFKLDDEPFLIKYFTRGGGYYLDVGASSIIADGKIRVKQGQEIKRFLKDGVEFADGEVIKADVVVLATGYQSMRTTVAKLVSKDVAAKCKDVWGLDEQGELNSIWRNSGHENFYLMGGNLALCRYMSKRLALFIKMIETGLATHPERKITSYTVLFLSTSVSALAHFGFEKKCPAPVTQTITVQLPCTQTYAWSTSALTTQTLETIQLSSSTTSGFLTSFLPTTTSIPFSTESSTSATSLVQIWSTSTASEPFSTTLSSSLYPSSTPCQDHPDVATSTSSAFLAASTSSVPTVWSSTTTSESSSLSIPQTSSSLSYLTLTIPSSTSSYNVPESSSSTPYTLMMTTTSIATSSVTTEIPDHDCNTMPESSPTTSPMVWQPTASSSASKVRYEPSVSQYTPVVQSPTPPSPTPAPCFSSPQEMPPPVANVFFEITFEIVLETYDCDTSKCAEYCLKHDECRAIAHTGDSCRLLAVEFDFRFVAYGFAPLPNPTKCWNKCPAI